MDRPSASRRQGLRREVEGVAPPAEPAPASAVQPEAVKVIAVVVPIHTTADPNDQLAISSELRELWPSAEHSFYLLADDQLPVTTLLHQLADARLSGSLQLSQPFDPTEPLSQRELDVLRLLARGNSNQEIAKILTLAVSTIKMHIKHIYSKLGVHNRTRAIVQAQALHLL